MTRARGRPSTGPLLVFSQFPQMRHALSSRFYCLFVFLAASAQPVGAADSGAGVALLRGVELARTKYHAFRVEMTLEYLSPPPVRTAKCVIEVDGKHRRCEVVSATGGLDKTVVLIDEENPHEIYGYRRGEYNDVDIYNMQRAVSTRGDIAFDPRILGLSSLMPANGTVKNSLNYDNALNVELLGQEELNERTVQHVRLVRNGPVPDFTITYDYWIEEPSFRVFRKSSKWPDGQSEITSSYGSNDTTWPFPVRVEITRSTPNGAIRGMEIRYTVQKFEIVDAISPERFTLASMDLPINTMINDYRINRIVGYWNGKEISPNPVYPAAPPVDIASDASRRRLWFIAVNAMIVAVLIALIWYRARRAA